MAQPTGKLKGTKEWSNHSVNCVTGCRHDCRYCYAKAMAARFGRADRSEWKYPTVRFKDVNKERQKRSGTVMFPTSHDITPEVLDPCLTVLEKLLSAGNKVLLVSKPHYDCLTEITDLATKYQDLITFRFTITAESDDLLTFWEPGAPGFEERLACLKQAYFKGFETSLSIEPCLDFNGLNSLIRACEGFVTGAIWIGKMNRIKNRVSDDGIDIEEEVNRVQESQSRESLLKIYNTHKNHPQVRWKSSLKDILKSVSGI